MLTKPKNTPPDGIFPDADTGHHTEAAPALAARPLRHAVTVVDSQDHHNHDHNNHDNYNHDP